MKPPTIKREIKIMAIFWKREKLVDHKMVNSNINMAQPIPARIVIIIRINGLDSFWLIVTRSIVEAYNCFDGDNKTP
jgi:hypothetical protein